MHSLLGLMLILQTTPATSDTSKTTRSLVDLFRTTDEYRQCLLLDKTRAAEPRDSFFAEGGMSAENLDLMLADRQDRLLKRLIDQGKAQAIVEALRQVRYSLVEEGRCRDFDPYYGTALEKLEILEKEAGIATYRLQIRTRPQRRP